MADPFDSTALFAEFNRPREASDRILMSNLKDNNQKKGSGRPEFGLPAEKGSKTNKEPSSSSSSDDSSSGDEESETETAEKEDADGPVQIGIDEAGCVMYRPSARERQVGMKLLQNADYNDGNDRSQVGDNGEDNRDELEKLRVTNNMYRKQTRLIDPTRHIPADEHTEGPALQVLFMNHDFSRKYRADIERFISDLIFNDMMDQPMRPVRDRPHHVCVSEGAAEVKDQDQDQVYHEHRTSTVIGASRFYTDFVVDNMGFPLVDFIPALSDGWEIPRYEQQFRKVLPAESESEDEDKPPPQKMGSMCFNCGGDHRLNECQEQRDFQRISAARNKFQSNSKMKQGTLNKGIEDSSKFSALKPGVYSKGLLEALGMQPNRLPFFVYRMRQLGYPPGYLMQAEVERSSMAMFDKDGKDLQSEQQSEPHESGSLEEGEMNEDNDKVVYDVDKLIDFPGFNVPPPENIPDEGHRYGCPPMQPTQSKEYMKNNLPTPRGLKRQTTRKEDHGGKRRRLVEDMDLDESETELSNSDHAHEESVMEVAPPLVWWQHYYQSAPLQQNSYIMTPPLPPGEEEYVGPYYGLNSLPPPLPPESPPRSPTPPPPPPDSPPQSPNPPSASYHPQTLKLSCTSVELPQSALHTSPENTQYLGPISSAGEQSPDSPVEWTAAKREACEEGAPRSIPLDRLLPCVAEGGEPGVSRSSSCASFSRSDTPTLEDLEIQQRLLRQELGDDDSQGSAGRSSRASSVDNTESHRFTVPEPPGTPGTPGANPPLPHVPPPQTPPAPPLPPGTPPVTPKTPTSGGTPLCSSTPGSDPFTTPVNSQSANTSLNRSNSASIEKTLSTPVRRKCTEDLPTATQFRDGVQDHIPFENLPDSVGTYDKMKDIISQIRRLKQKSQ